VLAVGVDVLLVLVIILLPRGAAAVRHLLSPYRARFHRPADPSACLGLVVADILHTAGFVSTASRPGTGAGVMHSDPGVRITFERLSYSRKKLLILDNMTGEIAPRKVTAILGPSGAGKTTFLRTIHNSVQPSEGSVALWHGAARLKPWAQGTKQALGYVPQFDVLFNGLSVRENIYHSGLLHAPVGWSQARVGLFVDNLLVTLRLTSCRDTVGAAPYASPGHAPVHLFACLPSRLHPPLRPSFFSQRRLLAHS